MTKPTTSRKIGRPTNAELDRDDRLRINITLTPDELALIDAQAEVQAEPRSRLIGRLIVARYG